MQAPPTFARLTGTTIDSYLAQIPLLKKVAYDEVGSILQLKVELPPGETKLFLRVDGRLIAAKPMVFECYFTEERWSEQVPPLSIPRGEQLTVRYIVYDLAERQPSHIGELYRRRLR